MVGLQLLSTLECSSEATKELAYDGRANKRIFFVVQLEIEDDLVSGETLEFSSTPIPKSLMPDFMLSLHIKIY